MARSLEDRAQEVVKTAMLNLLPRELRDTAGAEVLAGDKDRGDQFAWCQFCNPVPMDAMSRCSRKLPTSEGLADAVSDALRLEFEFAEDVPFVKSASVSIHPESPEGFLPTMSKCFSTTVKIDVMERNAST